MNKASVEEIRERFDNDVERFSNWDHVFEYIEKEDSPRPLLYQIDLLRQVGFCQVEILHKNTTFAAFGAVK